MDKQKFWDNKILRWEFAKYQRHLPLGLDVNRSLKWRRRKTAELLAQFAAGKSVVDLGCGSGTLLEELKTMPLRGYSGVDFSGVAIAAARLRATQLECKFPVEFLLDDVTRAEWDADSVCVALGLLDWLSDAELSSLLAHLRDRPFVISFSNAEHGRLARWAHRAYISLRQTTQSYRPRYFHRDELERRLGVPSSALSECTYGFTTIIHNLRAQ